LTERKKGNDMNNTFCERRWRYGVNLISTFSLYQHPRPMS
jgi:hypothetical protein